MLKSLQNKYLKKEIAKALAKKSEGYVLTAWDWFVLWVNKMGFVGAGYLFVFFVYAWKYVGNGIDMNLLILTACGVLFIEKNVAFFANIWKGAWHKLFPEDLIIPIINRKVK